MIMLWICVVIGIVVFGVMFVAMFRFRKSKGAVAATWSHSTKLEAAWTIIPILILIGSAWPATALLLRMADTADSEMTIKVTGYQWKWRYEYVDYFGKQPGINFISSLETQSNRTRQLNSGLDPAAIKVDGDLDLPARRRQAAGAAGRGQGALRGHRRRRHPRLVGTLARLEAGCDPRNHQFGLDPDRPARRLSRPMRRTVRP